MDKFLCRNPDLDEDTKLLIKAHKRIEKQLEYDKLVYRATHRLLLLGAGESGKSTIVKQMRILHINGFTDKERKERTESIKQNIRDAITQIVRAMSTLRPPVKFQCVDNEKYANYILETSSLSSFSFPDEYFASVSELWKDEGVRVCYERSDEFQLIDSAKYFLDKLDEIRRENYTPSDQDILRCRTKTTGIVETKFEVDKVRFHIFDVGGQRDERRKWIQCFNDVTAILFVSALSDYSMTLLEDNETNRLRESLKLFREIWANRWLKTVSVILFLNKRDVFAEKLKSGRYRLQDYFPEFLSFRYEEDDNCNDNDDAADSNVLAGKQFIKAEFLKIANCVLPTTNDETVRKCYPHYTCAVDTDNIRIVFNTCRKIIQKIHLQQWEIA